ncbi:hypothetical protein SD71_04490 [Cohnella kolymensis]|uniref:Uncharacterized protein n=1 Tax=Cohnella kolymensis TaxID=1590652 RepID=A0ABR5A7M4_9BACL|nr:hypothetical protein [Cohnella kolymensis]KIL36965.1 hypothetical protein SD71_04490 [Cohnella kolymensis]
MTGLLLYRETMDFLEPFMPGVLDACFSNEAERMKQLSLEQSDTFYQLLAAAAISDPDYSFYELNGMLITDSLSRLSAAGMRSVVVTKLEDTDELLLNLGFRKRSLSGLPEDHPSYGASVHEQDLRSLDFGEYVLAFLKAVSPTESQESMDSDFTEGDVQAALSLVSHAAALERSELARKLNCSGPDLQQKLQSIIFQDPPLLPLTRRKQALLQLLWETPSLTADAAAAQRTIVPAARRWAI